MYYYSNALLHDETIYIFRVKKLYRSI